MQHRYVANRDARRFLPFLLPHVRSGMSVLDVGCGIGSIALDLASHRRSGSHGRNRRRRRTDRGGPQIRGRAWDRQRGILHCIRLRTAVRGRDLRRRVRERGTAVRAGPGPRPRRDAPRPPSRRPRRSHRRRPRDGRDLPGSSGAGTRATPVRASDRPRGRQRPLLATPAHSHARGRIRTNARSRPRSRRCTETSHPPAGSPSSQSACSQRRAWPRSSSAKVGPRAPSSTRSSLRSTIGESCPTPSRHGCTAARSAG